MLNYTIEIKSSGEIILSDQLNEIHIGFVTIGCDNELRKSVNSIQIVIEKLKAAINCGLLSGVKTATFKP